MGRFVFPSMPVYIQVVTADGKVGKMTQICWNNFPCPSKGIKQGDCEVLSEGGTSTWLELLLLTQERYENL